MIWVICKKYGWQAGSVSFRVGIVIGVMCWFWSGSMGQAVAASGKGVSGTGSTGERSLQVGPYRVEVQFSADPPHVEAPLQVTVHVLEAGRFVGQLIGQPGAGTDAVPTRGQLTVVQGSSDVLRGELHLSVRGAWSIVIDLSGPRGSGSGTIDVTVSAPNAIPTWLGWLIGLSPLLGCLWLVYQQARYRRRLLSGLGNEEKGRAEAQPQGAGPGGGEGEGV